MIRIGSSCSFSTFIVIACSKIEIPPDAAKLADRSEERSLYLIEVMAHSIGGDQKLRFLWFYCQLYLADYEIAKFNIH